MFSKCGGQLRLVGGGLGPVRPIGLDYSVVMALAEAHGALGPLFFEILPSVERIIVNGPDSSDIGEDEGPD